jgi:Carbohydrate-selective porin, OprB family
MGNSWSGDECLAVTACLPCPLHRAAKPQSHRQRQGNFRCDALFRFRPWQGAEIWINPEIDQGFGLSNGFGAAGYLIGEAYKIGNLTPCYRMPRGFFRQTIDLGGETQKFDPDLNQLGGSETANRVVITIGKFSVVDIFDNNKYAYDSFAAFSFAHITADYQFVNNPAYNHQCGPVSVFAVRRHAEF